MRASRLSDAVQWAVVLAMFVAGAIAWTALPEAIPVHWNAAGEADRWGGKVEGLFLLPAITALLVLGLRFLPLIDPRRDRYAEFAGAYEIVRLAVVAELAGIYALTLAAAFGAPISMTPAIGMLVGLLLVVLGLVMDRVRPNWFVGIRTPWTLTSELSWTATHRLARWVFVLMGLAFALAGLLRAPWAFTAAAVLCAVVVIGLAAYSYSVWRHDPNRRAV